MALIYQLPTSIPATSGIFPNLKFMIVGDSLSSVTTAGYLSSTNLEGSSLSNNNIIMMLYSFNQQTLTGTFGIFTVAIAPATGLITLTQWINGNANSMLVNAVNTMTSSGQIILSKVNGTVATGAVTASGNSGVITTTSLTTAAGASTTITWTNNLISASSVVLVSLMGGTNTTIGIQLSATAGSGTSTLTISNNNASSALNGTLLIGYTVF